MKNRNGLLLSLLIFSFLLLFLSFPPISSATTWHVTSADEAVVRSAFSNAADGDIISLDITGTIELTEEIAVEYKDLSIYGPGPELLTLSGKDQHRVFNINASNVDITGITITNGNSNYGGCIRYRTGYFTLTNCDIKGGTASSGDGGGIHAFNAWFALTDCTIEGNNASNCGGGIFLDLGELNLKGCTIRENDATYGGGIMSTVTGFNIYQYRCPLNLLNCDISANTAADGGGILCSISEASLKGCNISENIAQGKTGGGGIICRNGSSMTLSNCTVGNNSAVSYGGGINIVSPGNMDLSFCTVSGNDSSLGGGIYSSASGDIYLKNSIIAGNLSQDLYTSESTIYSHGFNIIENSGDCALSMVNSTDIFGQDPMLASLDNWGGDTKCFALLPGSPAIDAASSCDLSGEVVSTDQRGIARPQYEANDIGSFEFNTLEDTDEGNNRRRGDGCILSEMTTQTLFLLLPLWMLIVKK